MLDILRRNPGMFGDRDQQRLVSRHMVEHAREERGFRGGLANRLRPDTCAARNAPQALGVPGHETEASSSPPPVFGPRRFARPAADPSFLAGVLDHVAGDEPLMGRISHGVAHRGESSTRRPVRADTIRDVAS